MANSWALIVGDTAADKCVKADYALKPDISSRDARHRVRQTAPLIKLAGVIHYQSTLNFLTIKYLKSVISSQKKIRGSLEYLFILYSISGRVLASVAILMDFFAM
jgi:hypothetical protein